MPTGSKESDLVFEVDYAKAFWNSRLSCERQRITATIPGHAVVLDAFAGVGAFAVFLARRGMWLLSDPAARINRCAISLSWLGFFQDLCVSVFAAVDAFAGVGAFAVFLARRGCVVAANDGNPASAANMRTNVKRNGVANLVEVHNEDARDFLRSQGQPAAITALLQKRMQAGGTPPKAEGPAAKRNENHSGLPPLSGAASGNHCPPTEAHAIRRNPAQSGRPRCKEEREPKSSGDVFPGLLSESEPQPKRRRPDGEALSDNAAAGETTQISKWRVHCYAFCRDPKPEQELKPRVEAALGCWPEPVDIQEVRDVAPHKRMYCLAFDLPLAFLRGECSSKRYEMSLLTNGCTVLPSIYLLRFSVANATAVHGRQRWSLHLSKEQYSSSPFSCFVRLNRREFQTKLRPG
ncbi:met-10 domain-containing protein, putative [Eimeria mitis]|uniref:Met-10 domain-containing protein, putative n=1 Tax=Eimeria mitis TaxID=44415 RepID=U6KBW2_9EIME|nr:met-10 domain-containing protein, putative [Eimeria mitis]CDJ33732.1 met-10 domain-containing protein, putative [Eimeria mitis]